MNRPRQCYAILPAQFHPEHGYIPSLVTEGESGHQPLIGRGEHSLPWYWGKTYEEAVAHCERMNEKSFGLTPAEAKAIVDSSLLASIREDAAKARHDEDYERKVGRHHR